MSIHKTVNGAYRHRYAPFLMPTYYVKRCSPLALPLGELSPQVTERVLQSFLNDNINLFTHITEISVDITVGESQNLLGCYPLGMVIVCPLRPRCARPPLPRGEARCFPGYFSPSGTRCARPPLPRGEARYARTVHRKLYRSAAFIS